MEFSVTHSLDRLVALYDALWAERFRRPVIVLHVVAVAATTAILVWPEARLIAVAIASACVVMIAVARVARVSMQHQLGAEVRSALEDRVARASAPRMG